MTFEGMKFNTFNEKSKRLPKIKEIKEVFGNFSMMDKFKNREEYVKNSYFILTDDFMKQTVKYIEDNSIKKVVEFGAGTGLLSYWLDRYIKGDYIGSNNKEREESKEIEIIAIDKKKDHFKEHFVEKEYFPLLKMDAKDYLKKNKTKDEDTLYISSWPNYQSMFAFDIIEGIKVNNSLLYIGEGMGGCTGSDEFHEALHLIGEDENVFDDSISFFGIHDFPTMYKKERELTQEEKEEILSNSEESLNEDIENNNSFEL